MIICTICGKEVRNPVEATVDIEKNRWTHHSCHIDRMIKDLEH